MQTLAFGRTGHDSTRTIFGAAALGGVPQAEGDRDNAASGKTFVH